MERKAYRDKHDLSNRPVYSLSVKRLSILGVPPGTETAVDLRDLVLSVVAEKPSLRFLDPPLHDLAHQVKNVSEMDDDA